MDVCRVYENDVDDWIYLIECSRLEQVVFRHYNNIDIERYDYPERIEEALDYLQRHKPTAISVGFNILTIKNVCEYIRDARNLEEVRFSFGERLDSIEITDMLLETFSCNRNVEILSFNIHITEDCLRKLGKNIDNSGIKNLDISLTGGTESFDIFSNIKCLTTLMVSDITDEECKMIAERFQSLRKLSLYRGVGDEGVRYLSGKKLEDLTVKSDNITGKGIIDYGKSLRKNIHLKCFSMSGSRIPLETRISFCEKYATQCPMLEYIWVGFLGIHWKLVDICLDKCKKITWNRYYIRVLGGSNPTVMGWKLACKRLEPYLPDELVDRVLNFLTIRD